MKRLGYALASALCLCAHRSPASDPPDAINTSPRPEFTGFYKLFVSVTDARDSFNELGLTDDEVLTDTAQRFRLQGSYAPTEHIDLDLHYELRALWGDRVRVAGKSRAATTQPTSAGFLARTPRARFLDLEHDVADDPYLRVSHELDRLRLRYRSENVTLAIGRQAVSWGTGLIWNPIDLFTGFAPNEIDRDYKPGVDVVRITAVTPLHVGLDLVAEPLDTNDTYGVNADDSALALRATTHVGEYDLAFVGGYVAGDTVAGGAFSGYLKDAGFRGEWSYTSVDESDEPDYFRGLLSLDYSFAMRWDPYVAWEYLYDGLGQDNPDHYLERRQDASVQRAFSRGTAFNLGRQYLGQIYRLRPSALLSFQSTTLWNLNDGSVLEFATLSRSLSDNAELIFGANVGIGPLGTEYGGFSRGQAGVEFRQPDFYYVFFKQYF